MYALNKGDYVHIIEAKKEFHKDFGEQYRVLRWEKPVPVTRDSIIEFLCLIKNIGQVRANNIVKALGNNALKKIIDEGPEILKPIPAIGKRAEQIYYSVLEQFELQLLVQELSPIGLTLKHITTAYKQLGADGARAIKKDPYILVEKNIASFIKADAIAINNGGRKDSPKRILASLREALSQALKLGHCYLPSDELVIKALKVLSYSVNKEVVKSGLSNAINSSYLSAEGENIYLPNCLYAEKEIARLINRFNRKINFPKKLDPIIDQYERSTNIILAEKQRSAIKAFFLSGIMVLTGGPGTGKTETIKAISKIYETIYPDHEIAQAAPTGRASRRLSEITNKEAKTIHRLLNYQPGIGPLFGPNKPLDCNAIIIDEFSMVDIFLAKDLLRAISYGTRILIVGDKDQLPPVGAGNVFKDLLDSDVPVVELTKIFRQAQESQIVSNAHLVNQGKPITRNSDSTDFYYLKTENNNQILRLTEKSVLRLLEKGYDIDEIQVLVPTRKDHVGVNNLNDILQKATNPIAEKEIKYGKKLFRINDKIMQTENNYEKDVFNGDIGKIVDISPLYDEGEKVEDEALHVMFGDKLVIYRSSELDQIELAYATTIHKSQGGEYKAVIMVLGSNHKNMATRNLVYTGMTRAEDFLCIIGSARTLWKAIQNNEVFKRYTSLSGRIKNTSEAVAQGL